MTTGAQSEQEPAAIAFRIIGSADHLTAAERGLLCPGQQVSPQQLIDARAAIRAGADPLGDDFIRLRSPAQRRARGAIYTPPAIVEAMIEWAANEPGDAPARAVDPGSGSGRFLLAAARVFPQAALVAADVDPLATLILRANAAAAGFSDRLTVHLADYLVVNLQPIDGRTLFVGNPPYVRHHQIAPESKAWLGKTAARYGYRASKLAGLHVHFFLRTRELARPGDFGAYITSSEWMDVNYGSLVRTMLSDGLGGAALHVLHPSASPFAGTLTTGAITCFRVGNRPADLTIRAVESVSQLKPLGSGKPLPWATVARTARWSALVHPQTRRPPGMIELGKIFQVHRGQVTGANAVWIAGIEGRALPGRFLFPAITHARELFENQDGTLVRKDHLRRVIDLPVDLDTLAPDELVLVERFLEWAKAKGADRSFVATHRRAWWSVGLREPPLILCSYMARRAPVFVRNVARAHYVNIAHGLYPRQRLTASAVEGILRHLRDNAGVAGGRTYAGGLVKYEPRELEQLLVPDPSSFGENPGT